MTQGAPSPRSVLFMPAGKPAMAAKIPQLRPDVAVLDLEDAVAASAKESARESLREALRNRAILDSGVQILIRVNEIDSVWFQDDLSLVGEFESAGVVLPKAESREVVEQVRAALPGRHLQIGIESALGVADVREILAASPDGCYFGAEDYIRDLGGHRTPIGLEVLYARSQVVLAARLAGCYAIDQAVVAVRDTQLFVDDAAQGKDLRYTGKLCLHPAQVTAAHDVFSPSAEEIAYARRVVEAAGGDGLGVVDGAMVDHVHIRQAQAVLFRAEANS